ncbi:DNA-binding transcriptional regulator, MarR family [Natronincola peptidivorans]|uniref:DNA-binding transcriptional regulator, MarR family n=1 Tax=Natronincola peptidivorans TaxID=426128 RepID=A0A1I0GRK7_9FIRM|nr:MarR family transcriptional regulator [Natronincola peptidivorans]SET73937.1 DNA-binding transcriptional regulator, MarR family [Natronincola peptidivorans]
MNKNHKSVGKYIAILYRQAQSYIVSQTKAYNIGRGQYAYLMVLFEQDGISQEDLSNQLMIDKGTTARAIDKLEKAGYVTRRINAEDRRAYNVFITDKAREIQPVLYRTLTSLTDNYVKDLNQDEKEVLYKILEKMVNSAMVYTKENSED